MPEPLAALAGIPRLAGSRVLRQVSDGVSSASWLCDTPEGLCVLRLDKPLAARLGLDRQAEWAILQAAHAADLGPEPVYGNASRGLLLTRLLPGAAWTATELVEPAALEQLGQLLRRAHAQPGVGAPFEPQGIAERYARVACGPGTSSQVEQVGRWSGLLYGGETCLCHHDPHAGNLVGRGPPRLVDWEYAASGQGLFDLAVVCRYHALAKSQRLVLLNAWAGHVDGELLDRLEAFCALYDLLALLWEQAVASG